MDTPARRYHLCKNKRHTDMNKNTRNIFAIHPFKKKWVIHGERAKITPVLFSGFFSRNDIFAMDTPARPYHLCKNKTHINMQHNTRNNFAIYLFKKK